MKSRSVWPNWMAIQGQMIRIYPHSVMLKRVARFATLCLWSVGAPGLRDHRNPNLSPSLPRRVGPHQTRPQGDGPPLPVAWSASRGLS